MGNKLPKTIFSASEYSKYFDKIHVKFNEYFASIEKNGYIEKDTFENLFFPLLNDNIPLNDFFELLSNHQNKISLQKLKNLYILFFQEYDSKILNQFLMLLIFRKKALYSKKEFSLRISELFRHPIDTIIMDELISDNL